MTTVVVPERTAEVIERMLEVLRRRPGLTVPELAEELREVPAVCLYEVVETLTLTLRESETEGLAEHDEAVALAPGDARQTLPGGWGPEPSPRELQAALAVADRAREDALAAALDRALTREQAAVRLGVSRQAVSERLKAGRLTALQRGREWRFPVWQFGEDATLPGLSELIVAWPGTPLALSRWAVTEHPDLGGFTPAQALRRRGGPERVLAAVEALTAAAW